jgi:antirestriction protein ArdC
MTVRLPDGSTKTVTSITEDDSRKFNINEDKRSPVLLVDTTIEYDDGSKDVWSRTQNGPLDSSSSLDMSTVDSKTLFYEVIGDKQAEVAKSYKNYLKSKHPNLEHTPWNVLAGLGRDKSTVGLVRPEALKRIQGNDAADLSSLESKKSDLESGEGIYEPIQVAYNPITRQAVVADGNHRVEAAIQAGEEYVPAIVTLSDFTNKAEGEFKPGLVEKSPNQSFDPAVSAFLESKQPREINPYFIFPDSDILLPTDSGADLDQSVDTGSNDVDKVFDEIRSRIFKTPVEKVTSAELPGKVAADISTNKNVVASVLQEVKEALKSPRDWVKNFTKQGRTSPLNPVNNHEYKAFNLVALSAAADKAGYSDPRWLTAQEAEKAYGAKLKAGATPTSIAVPTLREYQSEDGASLESVRFVPVQVYNAEQFDGMPKYEEPETVKYTPAEAFQVILDRFNRAEIERKGRGIPGILGLKVDETSVNPDTGKPLKSPNYSRDRVKLPLREQFKSDEAWIQSLAHELIHSTGAAFRQNRPETRQAGTDPIQRAKEEAIAEMASAMLMKMFGLNYDTKNSAAYIATEASRGKFSDADLVDISTKAQAAIDYMLGNDIDTMPKWDPTQTKRPKTPTEFRNTELTPLTSSINPDTSQDSIDALDLVEVSLDQNVNTSDQAKQKVYDALIKKLEELGDNKVPWRKGYKDGFEFTGGSGIPRNPSSKRLYSGFNSFWLKIAAMSEGYTDSRWMTYKQAQSLGGNVKKGETGTPILVPVKFLITKDKKGKPLVDKEGKPAGFAKLYFKTATVFNVAQIENLDLPDDKPTTEMAPVDAQEFILERYIKSMEAKGLKPPKIDYSYVGNYSTHDSSPNWSPMSDSITLPSLAQFNSPEEVFDTLMHELTHSTGHPSRLDRTELTKDYGNPDGQARAQEELIAEMGAAILGEMFGVEYDVDNTQAYMQSWFNVLKGGNPEILQLSASKAQQAVDYMLGMDLGDWSPLEGYNTYLGKQGQEGDEE